jgi:sugar transferase
LRLPVKDLASQKDAPMLRVLTQIVPREVALMVMGEISLGSFSIWLALQFTDGGKARELNALLQFDLALALTIVLAFTAAALGLYRAAAMLDLHSLLAKLALATVLGFLATAILPGLLRPDFGALINRIGIGAGAIAGPIVVTAVWLGCLATTQAALTAIVRRRQFFRRIVVVALPEDAARFAALITGGEGRRFEDIGLVTVDNSGEFANRLVADGLPHRPLWAIVIAAGCERLLPASLVLDWRLRGIRVLTEAAFWEHEGCWIDVDGADLSWVFDRAGFHHGRLADATKRALDLVAAVFFLALAWPLMLLVAIAVKLESPGPVLYRQERVGLHGRPFTLYKFRSMCQEAEAAGTPQWAVAADPRITQVGRIIRYTRMDELPQFFNVLRGEMSVVGPRPERPFFVDQLAAHIPFG